MKKKLALLLSAAMVVSMIPATAFAVTTNTISRVVNGTVDTVLGDNTTAPVLALEDRSLEDLKGEDIAFKLTLDNAEWNIGETGDIVKYKDATATGANEEHAIAAGDDGEWGTADDTKETSSDYPVYIQKLSSSQAIVMIFDYTGEEDVSAIELPLLAELTDDGDATVTIDPMDSVVSSGTYKFANVVEGDTVVTIADTSTIREGTTEIETITIEESAAGTLEVGDEIELRLSGDFEWANTKNGDNVPKISVYPSAGSVTVKDVDGDTMTLEVEKVASRAMTITLSGLKVSADFDDVEVGDVCEVTVSGDNVSRTTLEVGTATDYGVNLTVEDKTVPTFYSGRADDDIDSLEVTIKESIADSWITNRKTVLTFPSGVKIMDVDVDTDKISNLAWTADSNELEFNTVDINDGSKGEVNLTFQFSIAPDFTGDITATLSGAGVGEEQEVVVGTVEAPITVEAETNEVSIDYKNVSIGDITITEAYPGALEDGKTLSLELDEIAFDGEPTVEVVEGDLTIDEVEVDGGRIDITIDSESAKEAAVLKVTDVELYLDRSLPAGSYELKLVANDPYEEGTDYKNALKPADGDCKINGGIEKGQENDDAYFQTSAAKGESVGDSILFDNRELIVLDDYVEVVTAGRDQDDSTFTTQIKVTIGSNVMYAGKNEIQLDVPAYISNGYTMLPVRAVTKALSNVAIVRWDDATRTVTITFGSRIISMTVGSSTMNMNGVPVQMQAAVEITGDRAFIPLRDMGYALGLGDDKIAWDDATKTATLN